MRSAALLLALCECGARTELAGTIASDGAAEAQSGCHDEVIASDAKGAGTLALDGDVVFWGTTDGLVRTRDASGVTTLAAESDAITSVAVDAHDVYYAITGRIRRVPRGGGPAADVFTKAGQPFDIALRGTDVFWVDYGNGIAAGSVRLNGTPIVSQLDTPGGLAIDGGHVFVTCALALVNQKGIMGPLLRANTDGSELTKLIEGLHQPESVKAFGGRVYYLEQVDATSTLHGGVRSIDENGGAPKTEVEVDGFLPVDFIVDSSGVYVTALSQSESVLFRGTTQIAQTPGVVYEAVRTTATAVYWTIGWASTTPSGGATVRKLCK